MLLPSVLELYVDLRLVLQQYFCFWCFDRCFLKDRINIARWPGVVPFQFCLRTFPLGIARVQGRLYCYFKSFYYMILYCSVTWERYLQDYFLVHCLPTSIFVVISALIFCRWLFFVIVACNRIMCFPVQMFDLVTSLGRCHRNLHKVSDFYRAENDHDLYNQFRTSNLKLTWKAIAISVVVKLHILHGAINPVTLSISVHNSQYIIVARFCSLLWLNLGQFLYAWVVDLRQVNFEMFLHATWRRLVRYRLCSENIIVLL